MTAPLSPLTDERVEELKALVERWQADAAKVEQANTAQFLNAQRAARASRKRLEFEACLSLPSLLAELERARAAIEWYGEQARLCRLIHSEGDAGRHALAGDGGKRAREVLSGAGR